MGTWCTVGVVRCVSVNRCSVLITGAAPNYQDNQLAYRTGPDSLVDKASASGAGGRKFDSQCRRHWGSF